VRPGERLEEEESFDGRNGERPRRATGCDGFSSFAPGIATMGVMDGFRIKAPQARMNDGS
jgi:hypothetical protein